MTVPSSTWAGGSGAEKHPESLELSSCSRLASEGHIFPACVERNSGPQNVPWEQHSETCAYFLAVFLQE